MLQKLSRLFAIIITFSAYSCNRDVQPTLKFVNPLEIERTGEVITMGNNELTALVGEFPENELPLFLTETDTLTTQFINLAGDLIPEEILIEISLGPKESKNVIVKFIPASEYPIFPSKTNIRFARLSDADKEIITDDRLQTFLNTETAAVFQMEGPAWENDMVGFRNYFDLRNGMDIFGKRSPGMVLDRVGLGDNYHELADWGMDILKVGNSLGAGSIGVEQDNKLYRIGDNGNSTFERIYEGPLKSEFRFIFPEWMVESETYHITQYISITAGQNAYKSTVFASGLPKGAHIVSGIVNMLSDKVYTGNHEDYSYIYTHDTQAENKAYLAMALMIPSGLYMGNGEAPASGAGIIETYYGKIKPGADNEIEYYFYSLWENSNSSFADLDYVDKYLQNEALRHSNPVIVK